MNEKTTDEPNFTGTTARETKKSRVVVSVSGISCTTCGLAIEKQVKKMKGVDTVKTATMLNKIYIDYDPALVDLTKLKKAIDKTGYRSYMTVEKK